MKGSQYQVIEQPILKEYFKNKDVRDISLPIVITLCLTVVLGILLFLYI
jgi:hypothetical protein